MEKITSLEIFPLAIVLRTILFEDVNHDDKIKDTIK
tara:strand:- start:328 stop:435 length:108 start_codon:yes stop_codon:yes gene_type:complete